MESVKSYEKHRNTALYMRISKDDGEDGNSASIENQRKILISYAKEKGYANIFEYIDDGYTGTNFDRPSFQKMKNDIENGKIGTVITKDFSRLGRNTGKVMTMLDDFFVRHSVRYISVTEGIDTFKSDSFGMLAPMLSFTNELYSGDISRKINASFAAKMRNGEYIGAFAPFGYKKDITNKNKLVPDPDAAKVVRMIFDLAREGKSPIHIANLLNDKGVMTPSKYREQKSNQPHKSKTSEKWSGSMVSKILRNEVYLGHTIQGKTHKVSFKSQYIRNVPKKEWIRKENTHMALVDDETWRKVREKVQNRTLVREKGFVNIFSDIAKCADCGRNMSTVGTRKKGKRANLSCGGYKQYGKKACLSHIIDYDELCDYVLSEIRKDNKQYELLDRDTVKKLIDKIYVHQAEFINGEKKQRIDVFFKIT